MTDALSARADAARAVLAPIAREYPFTPRFHEHHGLVQHYVDEGPRAAPVLLFLHGNPTWSFLWRRPILSLRERYRCVAVDHIGCGLSDKPQDWPYTLALHVEHVERLLLSLDLRAVTLVMHDWGGAIGMGLARRQPQRIARLVLSNTAAFRARRIPRRIAACRVPVLGTLAVRGCNAFARLATVMAVERPLAPAVKRGFLLPYGSFADRIATLAFVRDIPMAPGHPSWDELVATETALQRFRDLPTLLCWGERDWCFTPRFREEWQQRFPAARCVRFDDAGHYVWEDAGERAVLALAEFLESTAGALPVPAAPEGSVRA